MSSQTQEQDKEMIGMVVDALTRLLQEGWQQLHEAGFLDLLLPAEQGGSALPISSLGPVLQTTGAHTLGLPFMSTVLGRWWLNQNNALEKVEASHRIGFARVQSISTDRLIVNESDTIGEVDWVLADAPTTQDKGILKGLLFPFTAIKQGECAIKDVQEISNDSSNPSIEEIAALGYSALLVSAGQRSIEMTLDYARQRKQFGRSIGRFQAIQAQLSEAAEQFFAMDMATRLAFAGWENTASRSSRVATAKLVSSEAALKIATVAHAVHGAIGITQEYELHFFTSLLYQCRRAFGAENYWAHRLGAQVLEAPQEQSTALDFILAHLS